MHVHTRTFTESFPACPRLSGRKLHHWRWRNCCRIARRGNGSSSSSSSCFLRPGGGDAAVGCEGFPASGPPEPQGALPPNDWSRAAARLQAVTAAAWWQPSKPRRRDPLQSPAANEIGPPSHPGRPMRTTGTSPSFHAAQLGLRPIQSGCATAALVIPSPAPNVIWFPRPSPPRIECPQCVLTALQLCERSVLTLRTGNGG